MIPRFTEFYIPILEVLSDIESKEVNTLIDAVAAHVGLSEDDKLIATRSGKQLRYRSNISWAITDLTQGGFIERPARGTYAITLEGLEFLEERPEYIDREVLASKSEKFRNFLNREGTRKKKEDANEIESEDLSSSLSGNNNSSSVTLKELYQTLAILKRANLSTKEIEERIALLEKEDKLEKSAQKIFGFIKNEISKLPIRKSITIVYNTEHSMSMRVGDIEIILNNKEIRFLNSNQPAPNKKGKLEDSKRDLELEEKDNASKTPANHHSTRTFETEKEITKSRISTGVWIKPHSKNSFCLYGDTEPFRDILNSFGGYYCSYLKGGPAWVFLNGKEEGLRRELKQYIIYPDEDRKGETKSLEKNEALPEKNPSIVRDSDKIDRARIERYKNFLNSLKSFNFLGVTGPHKPILLLAIFEFIHNRIVKDNKIYYTSDLEQRYNSLWNQLIKKPVSLGAPYPYAHLISEKFITAKVNRNIYSLDKTWNQNSLKAIDYLLIDRPLWELLKNREAFKELSAFIIQRYCGENALKDINFKADKGDNEADFRSYLKSIYSKKGKEYNERSITVYVGALKSQYMAEQIESVEPSGNIYCVEDVKFLFSLSRNLENASKYKDINSATKTALRLYVDFLFAKNNKS